MPVSRKRKSKYTGRPVRRSERPAQSPMMAKAKACERYMTELLDHYKRAVITRGGDPETREVIGTIQRIFSKAYEFDQWLKNSPEAEWIAGASAGESEGDY